MTNRWECEYKAADISSDFGRDYAMRVFSLTFDQLEAIVGRYTKGKRKGQLRGRLSWYRVVKGGWVKTGRYDFDGGGASGFVAKPGVRFGHSINDWGRHLYGAILGGDSPTDIATLYRDSMRLAMPPRPISNSERLREECIELIEAITCAGIPMPEAGRLATNEVYELEL